MSSDYDPYHRWLGIPRHQQPANHYRLLGIELYEADPSVIDDAASRQMAHVRTYAIGEHVALSQRIMNELAAARICLLNAQKKAAYDCTLRSSLLAAPAPLEPPALEPLEPGVPDANLVELEALVAQTFNPKPAATPPPLPVRRHGQPRWLLPVSGAAAALLLLIALLAWHALEDSQPPARVGPVATGADAPDKLSASVPAPAGSTASAGNVAPAPVQPPLKAVSAPVVEPSSNDAVRAAAPSAKAEPAAPVVVTDPAQPVADILPLKLEDLIESVERSVVVVDTGNATGSGFVFDTLGTIVTNYHVIQGANVAQVRFKDGSLTNVVGYVVLDAARDLALLHVDLPVTQLHPLPIARDVSKKGQRTFAFGTPKRLDWSVAEGIVSGLRTGYDLNQILGRAAFPAAMAWIQTTAAISSGNSGGPLIDEQGRVIGVNTMVLFPGSSQNLNFAVSAQEITSIYNPDQRQVRPLPQNTAPPTQPLAPPRPTGWTVQLPGDRSVSSSLAELNVRATWSPIFRQGSPVALVQNNNYHLAAECELATKRLDGLLTVVFPTGRPKLHAIYKDNKRDGSLVRWNADGSLLYYERNRNDKPYEICCLFKDNLPWLIEVYDRFNRVSIHRIDSYQVAATYHDEQEAVDDPSARQAFITLQRVRGQLEQEEISLKRDVRDFIDDVRRQLATRNSVLGRDAILSAMQQRNAANQATLRSFVTSTSR